MASSTSLPGVRMVTPTGRPATRSSNGSSTASRSRAARAPSPGAPGRSSAQAGAVQVAEAGDLGAVVDELQVGPGEQVGEAHLGIQAVGHLAAPDLVQLGGADALQRDAPAVVRAGREG